MKQDNIPSIKIYNTLTGNKETFKPLVPGEVGIYVCGMTVYDYCHIGHARVLVAFDVIIRYLKHIGYDVTYVRNITDVDDKIFNRANESGEEYTQLTRRFIQAMHEDERALSVLPPDFEPRATAHIEEIISMIQTLIDKQFAYITKTGDVYYRVHRFEDYGKLSKKNLDDLRAGARVEVDALKESPVDFALWKATKPGEASWSTPWGEGRPGWHIECSAMSTQCLGHTFDIHGGGPDLKFPHHENEIAQSEAATGKPYVNIWMHAGAVRVDDEKMSKSLGNFFTIREVLEKYNPEVVRYFIIASQYRSPINYSEENLKQAQLSLERFYTALRSSPPSLKSLNNTQQYDVDNYRQRFHAAMADDFNTPEALAVLFDLVREINKEKATESVLSALLVELGDIIGILQQDPGVFLQGGQTEQGVSADEINSLILQRNEARQNKNWVKADEIRDHLLSLGITLDDSREGTSWRRQGS